MIILYFGHYRFHEFAIKLLVKKKTKNPHCDARVQRDEEVVVFAEFARNEWAYSDVNIGRYIAQGQTDPAELDRAIGLTDEELVVIRDVGFIILTCARLSELKFETVGTNRPETRSAEAK